ncbi:MAG: RagB/SusD family nutrient uptake outer membrane protein [Paludibacteraceae bacterium]|nr:RagB/SusD family nutrient uptake outer membrane protein [Paludibacteraceae bacterium]
MKKLKYIILSLCVIGMASCDLLENDSKSAMNDEMVFSSTQSAEQAIAGIYEVFGEQNAYRTRLVGGWVGLNTDIEFCTKAQDYAIYKMNVMGHSDLVMKDKNPWAYLTAIIERTNLCIKGIDDALASREAANNPVKGEELVHFNYLKGEAICLRSFAYYEILKLWGDAPYNFEPVDILDPNSIYKPVAPRVEIFQRLREDLKLAAELMPWSEGCPGGAKNFTGRPSKAFALGLRARINLMYAGYGLQRETNTVDYNTKDDALRAELYQEVADDCSKILEHEENKIIKYEDGGFEQVFKNICQGVTDYSQSEVIWEIPFLDGVRGQLLNRCGLRVNKDKLNAFGKLKNTDISNSSNGMVAVTPYLLNLFFESIAKDLSLSKEGVYGNYEYQKTDKRLNVTIAPYQWQYRADNNSNTVDPTKEKPLLAKYWTKASQMYLGKYRFEWLNGAYTGEDDGLNLPIMRMSEVALMLAEAMEKGATSSSYTKDYAFNLVHKRATGKDLPGEVTMVDIKRERALEFAGENLRKYDLIRWGEFDTQLKYAKNQSNYSYIEKMNFVYFEDSEYSNDPEKWPAYDVVWWAAKDARLKSSDTEKVEIGDELIVDGESVKITGVKSGASFDLGVPLLLYDCKDEELEHRQYWPFFNVITNANPKLENAYDY